MLVHSDTEQTVALAQLDHSTFAHSYFDLSTAILCVNQSNGLQNGTVAAASYAGSTLAYVAPQMAGAIDIMVVSQPDGSLRSSPFYGTHLLCSHTLYECIHSYLMFVDLQCALESTLA